MKYAICQVSVSPLRAEASDRSEMVSQLLFGEKVEIIEQKDNWIKIKAEFDNYEGWTDRKQFLGISEEEFQNIHSELFASESFNLLVENDNPITLPIAAHLPNLINSKINLGNKEFEYLGESCSGNFTKSDIVSIAQLYLNTPYLWGGKSVFGIDCSGLVQQVYKLCGHQLPRDAYQQAELGEALSFIEEAEPGDLAFFDNKDGKIIHVGIILEGNKIIHAHGKVRIDPFDNNGIFNTDFQNYSHKLRVAKKII